MPIYSQYEEIYEISEGVLLDIQSLHGKWFKEGPLFDLFFLFLFLSLIYLQTSKALQNSMQNSN